MAEFTKMVKHDYGIKPRPITTRNPQANAIIERVYQTTGSILKTFDMKSLDKVDPWGDILAVARFSVRATYHTTMRASPMQLFFERDTILNIKHVTDWTNLKRLKQQRINSNNKQGKKSRFYHTYQVGDQVLLKTRK